MARIVSFTFNPFEENTYLLYDDTKSCIIIDPGCYTPAEKTQLSAFIAEKGLKPTRLINTHCHLDHILGNSYIAHQYNLELECHEYALPVLRAGKIMGSAYGVVYEESPEPASFLKEGDVIELADTSLKVLFTPGHSPGSISFYNEQDRYIIAGDVLFYLSIGRYDLPGSNLADLKRTLFDVMMKLDDDVTVYSGHGPKTTIGFERKHNPFLKEGALI